MVFSLPYLVIFRQPANVSLGLQEVGGFVIRSTSAYRYIVFMFNYVQDNENSKCYA